ncbi:MAG: HD domain-containing protein [Prochloraceae cyanobacterium]|nr:HD domain-containing protein [Prochloraceae cyanobacterium]
MSAMISPATSENPDKVKQYIKYAQTNLQLFNQLRNQGYSDSDLSSIQSAYHAAVYLYTGCFRPSGKTFLSHLVGNASILASLGCPAKIVAAGMLHAAYYCGGFGENKKGITPTKRQKLIEAVGEEVEEYVARYTKLEWNQNNISVLQQRLDSLDKIDREVLLMRLANELEEYLDLGLLYCKDKQQEYFDRHPQIVAMAEKLGFPALAAELAMAHAEMAKATIPPELCYGDGKKFDFFIPPRHRKPIFRNLKRAIRRKLGK